MRGEGGETNDYFRVPGFDARMVVGGDVGEGGVACLDSSILGYLRNIFRLLSWRVGRRAYLVSEIFELEERHRWCRCGFGGHFGDFVTDKTAERMYVTVFLEEKDWYLEDQRSVV